VAVLNEVLRDGLTETEAAALLGMSARQIRYMLAAYRTEGVPTTAHGNRPRLPSNESSSPANARLPNMNMPKQRPSSSVSIKVMSQSGHASWIWSRWEAVDNGVSSPTTQTRPATLSPPK